MSVGEFVGSLATMGGYGFYVWGSYAACVLAITAEIVIVRSRLAAARRAAGGREPSP